MIYDPGFVHRRFQQCCIENLLALIGQSLRDLLANARTLQSQILCSQPLLSELKDVPLATAAKSNRLRVIANLHRTEETRDQLRWKVVLPQILFGCKPDVTAGAQAGGVFAPAASNGSEI